MPKRFPEHISFQAVLESLLHRPLIVILSISAATLFFAWHIPQLTFFTSIYDLMVEDLPDTARYDEFKNVFGSDEIIRIVIKGKNVFAPITFRKIEHLAEAAAGIEGVRRVISLPGIKKAIDVTGKLNLEEFASIVAPVKLFQRNLVSDDRNAAVITLVLKRDADNERVIQAVNNLIAGTSRDLYLYQIGIPLVSQALVKFTEKDFFRLPPITLLIVAVILFLLFRNFAGLLIPFACVMLSLLWTFGLMGWTQVPLSMLTMIVPVFLIAVGTAYCLHIVSEYLARAALADSPLDAVLETFSRITLPSVLAVFTTVIGIGSLLINKIPSIREFALFSCFGMFSLLVIVLTFLPALLVLLPLPGEGTRKFAGIDRFFDRFLERIIRLNLNHQKTIFLVIGTLAAFCIVGLFRIRAETNPLSYFKENVPVSRHFHDIYQDLSGSFPVNVFMNSRQEDYFGDPLHIDEIARLQTYLETLPKVDKTVSFADYLKLVNYALNRFDPKQYRLPEEAFEARMLINNYKSMLGQDLLTPFMSGDFSSANILLLTHLSSSREFLRTRENILAHVQQNFSRGHAWDVTGFGMVASASSELLTSGQVKSLFLSMGLIFSIMLMLFLSARVGLIAVLPNCFPIIINFGLMGWLGINLSLATSLIAGIAIGLAVDDTIHYLVRYNREFKKDLDKDRALRDTITHMGRPIVFSTITISLGFSVLLFSHFKPTAIFGFLMVITMVSALAGDLILLPALMLHVELVTAWDLLRLMPTLGGISSGIAHELIQPLTAIKLGSEFLKRTIQQGKKIQEEHLFQVLNEISGQVNRASNVINRLREFGQKSDFEKEPVDINEPIRDTLEVIGHELSLENIDIQVELDETLPPILGHKNRLVQVIYNLLTNACDAIKEKNEAAAETGSRSIAIRSFRENDRVVVTVSDSGIGIPAHLQGRILEPFFTTKNAGKGKGLGLSISNQIVRNYGGNIHVQSQEKSGTTIKLTFPFHHREK